MFEALLKSKFYTKSKYDIKLIRIRIDMILKKRNSMLNYMRKDVADLLKNGLDIDAYGRVDGLLAELNRSSCYEFIEQSSLHILNHLVVMNKQRECPEECKEAVSSLMFAAARFADLPELRDLRTLFLENYGDSLNSFANKEFVEKLKSAGNSSKDMMSLQLLQDIASENDLQWNSKDLKNKLCNEPVSKKSFGAKRIDDKFSLQDENKSNSVEKTGPGGPEHERKNLREVYVPKRRNNLSNYGHEEATKTEDNVSLQREDAVSPRDNNVPIMLNKSNEGPPVKDIQVGTEARSEKANGSESVKRVAVLEVENHENKPQKLKVEERENTALKYTSVRDHIRHEVIEMNFHLSEYMYSTRDKQKDDDRTGLVGKVKPVTKSVRMRHDKPPPIHENSGNAGKRDHSKETKENVGEGRRILKFLDEVCNNQDDEKMMEQLLLHYSKKKGLPDTSKLISNLSPADSSDATKRSRDGPNQTTSLPCESLCPTETPKAQTRAPKILEAKEHAHGHVHPKLPEYDDLVARLASIRGRH